MIAVDMFAGWGGFSLGAAQAGASVRWAANHWPLAVMAHLANHPEAIHVCQDLRQADWTRLPEHDLLLASPACQGHSQAAQGARKLNPRVRPRHDALRATAWAVVDCAEVCRPRGVIVENVPDFKRWELYPIWCDAMRALGYRLEERRVVASRCGVPQRRDRLFVLCTLGGAEIPELDENDEPPFAPCIEWDAPATWKPWRSATPSVVTRVERSRARHGRRFLTQHVRDHYGVGLDEPIRTITGADQWAIVDGPRYRPLTIRETARAMGFPDDYRWPTTFKGSPVRRRDYIKGLGNAVCPPVARALVEAMGHAIM